MSSARQSVIVDAQCQYWLAHCNTNCSSTTNIEQISFQPPAPREHLLHTLQAVNTRNSTGLGDKKFLFFQLLAIP